MKREWWILIGVGIIVLAIIVVIGLDNEKSIGENECSEDGGCFLRYIGDSPCASCDPSDEDWTCLNREKLEDYKYPWEGSDNVDIACAECIPNVHEMATCVCSGEDCKKEIIDKEDCNIINPDPEGYLLKICEYLNKENIIIDPATSDGYKINSIREYEDRIEVRLDCCYMGDLAWFDKETKEIISFSPGDI